MKTTKRTITIAVLSILSILSTFINSGCGTDTITGTNTIERRNSNSSSDSITITVAKVSGGFEFNLQNNTLTTIVNDFHVQFDSSVTITDWGLYWQMDPNSTNLEVGRIGEKAGPGQQPVNPGQQHAVLWVKVRHNGAKILRKFDWQATRDGVTVQSGKSILPE